jgi:hypothetical protein
METNKSHEEKILNTAKRAYEIAEDSSAKRVPWHCLADHWRAYWINLVRAIDKAMREQG